MGATSVGESFGEHTKGIRGNISGEHKHLHKSKR
jgi:hypothetical protein